MKLHHGPPPEKEVPAGYLAGSMLVVFVLAAWASYEWMEAGRLWHENRDLRERLGQAGASATSDEQATINRLIGENRDLASEAKKLARLAGLALGDRRPLTGTVLGHDGQPLSEPEEHELRRCLAAAQNALETAAALTTRFDVRRDHVDRNRWWVLIDP